MTEKSVRFVLAVMLIFVLSACFYMTVFSVETSFDRETPLYLRNFASGYVDSIHEDLKSVWGFELSLPVKIVFEKGYGLAAKGEAVMYPDHHEIILSPSASKIPELLRHEIMHLFTFEWMLHNEFGDLPLWFIEGLAVWYENRVPSSISNLDPLNTWKETDFLGITKYPEGDAFSRYYDFLADFFYSLQKRRDFRNGLEEIMNSILVRQNTVDALSDFYESDFVLIHGRWRLERTFISFWGFVFINMGFIFPALVILFLGIYTFSKNKNIKDTFSAELEKKYGKNYWKEE